MKEGNRRRMLRIMGPVVVLLFAVLVIPGVSGATVFEIVASESQAGYRVREQLLGKNFPSDAVGTTRDIRGSVTLDSRGRVLPGGKITVDLRTLRSDEQRRDNYLRRNTLDTASFPYTEFIIREVDGLPSPLPSSGSAEVRLRGDLSLHGVSRPAEWNGTAVFEQGGVRLRARTAFKFDDFSLTRPSVMRVLSVEDNIRLEVDLTLRPVPSS